MKLCGDVRCVTSKNWLDFDDDLELVTVGLGLRLHLLGGRFVHSECSGYYFLLIFFKVPSVTDLKS